MRIEKKTWPEFFEKVLNGEKTFELRLADFKCKSGDTLVLREWDPKTKKYTGRTLEKTVAYVINTKNVRFHTDKEIEKYGFYVISIK